jgi:hypothetical protein
MILRADALRLPFADRSFDLVMGSPPYVDARLYLENGQDLGIARKCQAWVRWMLDVTAEALRVSRGLVLWVCAGNTKNWCYQPAPEGLLWEWWQRGGECHCLRPCYWNRSGISGSGAGKWYRSDIEYVLAFKRPGAPFYGEPTANGHPPLYPVGVPRATRIANGQMVRRNKDTYRPVEIANPGNLIRAHVGRGHMGSSLAHENEAPYPERIPEFFIRSHCPPGGTVLDPFSGSGTTVVAARKLGRVGVGADLRQSQCLLGKRRIAGGATAPLVGMGAA